MSKIKYQMSNISKVKLLSERIQRKYKWKCQWFYFHFQILLRSAYIIKRESWAGTVEDCEGFGGMLVLPVRTIATMKRNRVTKSITITRATCAWMSFKHCKNGHGHGHGHGQLNTPNLPNKNCVICNTDIGESYTLDVFRLQSDCCDCIKGLKKRKVGIDGQWTCVGTSLCKEAPVRAYKDS